MSNRKILFMFSITRQNNNKYFRHCLDSMHVIRAISRGIFMVEYSLTTINDELDNEISLFHKVKYISMTNILRCRHQQYESVKTI